MFEQKLEWCTDNRVMWSNAYFKFNELVKEDQKVPKTHINSEDGSDTRKLIELFLHSTFKSVCYWHLAVSFASDEFKKDETGSMVLGGYSSQKFAPFNKPPHQ